MSSALLKQTYMHMSDVFNLFGYHHVCRVHFIISFYFYLFYFGSRYHSERGKLQRNKYIGTCVGTRSCIKTTLYNILLSLHTYIGKLLCSASYVYGISIVIMKTD